MPPLLPPIIMDDDEPPLLPPIMDDDEPDETPADDLAPAQMPDDW